jgi:hypothetical protein
VELTAAQVRCYSDEALSKSGLMTKYLNIQEERGGTRRFYLGAVVIITLIIVAALVWSLLSPAPTNSPNGQRTDQQSGVSEVAKRTAPPPSAAPNATTPETVGRNEHIEATENKNVSLNADQRKAVDDFVAHQTQQKTNHIDFTIAVGAAVPRNVSLGNIPRELADKLSSYSGDQYLVISNRFVVVERATRRIVAIIPVAS